MSRGGYLERMQRFARRLMMLSLSVVLLDFLHRRFTLRLQGRVEDIRVSARADARAKAVVARLLRGPRTAFTAGYAPSWFALIGGSFKGSFASVISHILRVRALRNDLPVDKAFRRERFPLSDGGTVALDWLAENYDDALQDSSVEPVYPTDEMLKSDAKALVVIHHGLAGSSSSEYVRHIAKRLHRRGFRVCVFVARGCGGNPLTTPDGFNAARTMDLREIIKSLRSRVSTHTEMFAIGYSLGACLLLKYLGEEGEACPLRGAVAISPCFDFDQAHEHFHLWSRYHLVRFLKEWAVENRDALSRRADVVFDDVLEARDVREFDRHAIVRDGSVYATVDDYYRDASASRYAQNIHVPTLALASLDDPVATPTLPTRDQAGPGLCTLALSEGGHVAFPSGAFGEIDWMDQVIVEWLAACERP